MKKLIRKTDIGDGEVKTVVCDGAPLVVARKGEDYFVFDDACTHAGCSLGTLGSIDGMSLVCGCHGAVFDLKTGEVRSLPATRNLRMYQVSMDTEWIYIPSVS